MARTAAILVIGNEVLTGKVEDRNVSFLARELFSIGIRLQRVVICADEIDTIASDVRVLRRRHDVVLTTGGVGPTHDDVTIESIAKAFDVKVARSAELLGMLAAHYGDRMTEAHARMADVPEGAILIRTERIPWPTIRMDNVFVLPGVPELIRLKFAALRGALGEGVPFASEAVYTHAEEPEIASVLSELAARYPDIAIGSYPAWRNSIYKTKITFDGQDVALVRRVAEEFRAALSPDRFVEPPSE